MYKKITALLCLTLSIVLFGFTASATDAINTVYVSGTAAEGGTGVISAPVSSLAEAYSLIGSMRNGTIYLMDTVSVSATSGDCFIAPTHIGKITISSADGYDGALDLSGVEHYHFGGETEFSSLELIANDLVLSADNHALILGEGITVSSLRGNSEYRNGHTFCGANINVTVYCPCENATAEITTADGSLYIFSGEYRSVSSWLGSSLTVDSGKINIFLGGVGDTDTLWVRYLCPGLFGSKALSPLTCNENTYVYVDVMLDSGANIAEFYSSTQNLLVGRICVNWKLFNNVCTDTVAIASSMLTPLSGSSCRITASVSREDAVLIAKAQRISGKNDVSVISECSASNHDYYTRPDGRIVCMACGYEKCRHLTTVTVETAPATCTDGIEYTTYCTDLCGDSVGKSYGTDVDPNNHSGYIPKYNYSETYSIMA